MNLYKLQTGKFITEIFITEPLSTPNIQFNLLYLNFNVKDKRL